MNQSFNLNFTKYSKPLRKDTRVLEYVAGCMNKWGLYSDQFLGQAFVHT